MKTHRPPLVCADAWSAVMTAAGHRCTCTGACGQKHTIGGGQCDATNGRAGTRPLIASPADPARGLTVAAAAAAPLAAWCQDCWGKALGAARRRADLVAAAATTTDALFDL